MSATPEQIAERLDDLAKTFLKSAKKNREDTFSSVSAKVAAEQEAHGNDYAKAAALIRAQAERVRVLEEALKAMLSENGALHVNSINSDSPAEQLARAALAKAGAPQ